MERLNLAGQLARYFVDSRLTILIVVGLLVFGVVGLVFTPREENPQIVVPAAEVSITLPGAPPSEVEHLLLSPLEAELSAIDGVKHIYGTALEGLARIDVEFEVGEDKEDAMVRLYDHVLRNRHRLPVGASEPLVQAIDVDEVPIFAVTLASEDYSDYELRRMADRMIERLRSVSGVGLGYVVGGRERELRIEIIPERLHAYGISLDEVVNAIRAADVSQPLGIRVYSGENRALRVDGLLHSQQQVENIVVKAHEGRILRLADLATVVDGPPTERTHLTRFAFGRADNRSAVSKESEMAAVTLAMAKRKGVNSVDVTATLRERVAQMEQGFLPPNVHVIITRDDGLKADRAVSHLIGHLFIAIGAVSLVLLLFLGRRPALVVAVAIPLVFAAVMGADLMAGPTLNRITLYALIIVLGLLVDDAIVVTENIHRHFSELPPGTDVKSRAHTAVLATHEIGNPTTLATLTVAAVFVSLILVTGMLGEYFYPVTFNVPVAILVSLIIAYTVTPWLAHRWLPVDNTNQESQPSRLQDFYRATITPLLKYQLLRRGFYVGVALLLILSFLQPAWQFVRPQGIAGAVSTLGLPLAFLPKDNKNTFLIHVHLPETTPLEVSDRASRELGELLRRHPHVMNYQTYVGIPALIDFNGQLRGSGRNVGPQFAEIRVNLVDKFERDPTSIELVIAMRSDVESIAVRYPGGVFRLIEDPPGPPVRATVLAEIYGPDTEMLSLLAQRVATEYRATYDMAETFASIPFDVPEYRIRVDRQKTGLAGVNPAQVTQAVTRLMAGETLAYAHFEGERAPVPIRLNVPREQRIEPTLLERAFVTSSQGQRVPLSELTRMVLDMQYRPINHKNTERVEYVGGELTGSAPVYAVLDLDRRFDGLMVADGEFLRTGNLRFNPVRPNTLEGYQLLWDGELRLTLDAFRDMGLALGLALLAVYILLVGYYRSFTLPLLAMSAVPLAFIGVFPGHWLLGVTFSAASMVGVIALAGVVVRNSLLLIDFAEEYRAKGYSLEDAVREAGAVRLRPILLTTISTVLGMAIMVPDPTFGGLAISLIFGVTSSAVFAVLVVPLLYWRRERRRSVP